MKDWWKRLLPILLGGMLMAAMLQNAEAAGDACRELFVKYKVFADHETSAAYRAACLRRDTVENDDGSVVLIARDSPSLDEDFIRRNIGELPPKPDSIRDAFTPTVVGRPVIDKSDTEQVLSVLNSLNLRRMF